MHVSRIFTSLFHGLYFIKNNIIIHDTNKHAIIEFLLIIYTSNFTHYYIQTSSPSVASVASAVLPLQVINIINKTNVRFFDLHELSTLFTLSTLLIMLIMLITLVILPGQLFDCPLPADHLYTIMGLHYNGLMGPAIMGSSRSLNGEREGSLNGF